MEVISTNINDSETIELYWQDEVILDIDLSLVWIKSGQKEIQDYVDDIIKPEIADYINTQTNSVISNIIKDDISPLITSTSVLADQAVASANLSASSAELSKQYANDKINQTHITNCITEMPQDIKLELTNGILTLKAGSKVYVPNGTGKFDEVVVTKDIVRTNFGGTYTRFVILNPSLTDFIPMVNAYSGSSVPTVSGACIWYDTVNNIVKYTNNSGTTWTSGACLPIAVVSTTEGAISSIDQVFNGFGYIGSTVFALPGVKGLIPNGKNEDGSLKNAEFTVSKVSTVQAGSTSAGYIGFVNGTLMRRYSGNSVYDESKNIWYNPETGNSFQFLYCGDFSETSAKITSFTPKLPFRAADYNDYIRIKDYIIERGKSGNQWYELYRSKRLRQGGFSQSGSITFIKPYANNNYTLINGSGKSTTGFSAGTNTVDWITDGEGA